MKSKILGFLAAGLLAAPMSTLAAGVVVGDKEWRQLTETTNYSWNTIASVCSPTTGACIGSIGQVSFDGWTWATNTDIQALFDALIQPAATNFATSSFNYFAPASADIAASLGGNAFTPTYISETQRYAWGWSRTIDGSAGRAPLLQDFTSPTTSDTALLGQNLGFTYYHVSLGAWLYRAVPVPEPTTLALLGLGLFGLGTTRRRKLN